MSDPSTTRKPRRKATTEVGRAILQRERQRLAREQAALGEALVAESRIIRNDIPRYAVEPVDVEQNAIARGIVRRIAAVLASEEINVPITVSKGIEGAGSDAWTDFSQISVTYQPQDDKRVLAATMRGLFYHEGGHCRWTIPFPELLDHVRTQASDEGVEIALPTCVMRGVSRPEVCHRAWNMLEDQRMETAVVSDSPRKAAYFTPMIMTEHTPTPTAMAANYPLLIWRKYLPRKLRYAARKMFIASHDLQGQDGTRLAEMAESIVTNYVLSTDLGSMWQAVCDMHDLLQEIQPVPAASFGHDRQYRNRNTSRNLDDFLVIPVDPGMLDEPMGETIEIEDEDGDEPEVDFTDPAVADHLAEVLIAMWWHPETLIPVVYALQGAPEPSNEAPKASASADEPEDTDEPTKSDAKGDASGAKADDEPETDKPETEAEADESDTADKPDDEDERDDEDDDAGSGDGAGSDGSHTDDGAGNVDDDFDQDDLDDLLQEVEDERNEMRELDGDMRAFDEAREQTSSLPVYVGGLSNDGVAINKSVALADEIERSFQMSTMDRQPSWVEQQRRGIVNVLRYETRRPGETEVFRAWTDDEQPGYDMAVSLLLDYSGSMDDHMVSLAQSAFAVKLACQRLEIPCTVTLWDTEAMALWDANEVAQGMPVIQEAGGTDPTRALQDLDNQRYDRAKHIVIIMTDGDWSGEWNGKRTLAAYKDAGRQIYGFGLGGRHLREGLIAKGCDNAWAISDLMEIPQRLEQFLVESA